MSTGSTALNGEFVVNTSTSGAQYVSAISRDSDGGYTITWQGNPGDGDGYGVLGQRYDVDGNAVGTEFQVNSYTTGAQNETDVTYLVGGGFVVTWTSDGQDTDGNGIYAQIYDSAGVKVGSEFRVNTHVTESQQASKVEALDAGGFVVVWVSHLQDSSAGGIYGQQYDAVGATVGSEFLVNTETNSFQQAPNIAALSDGGYVVVWESYLQAASGGYSIYGQRYAADGSVSGSEFIINTELADSQKYADVSGLANGGFVVTWQSNLQDGSEDGIYGQMYDAAGNTVGSELHISTATANDQEHPAIAGLADGGFVVTWWSDNQDGSTSSVFAQRYDANGETIGSEFSVADTTTNSQTHPEITGLDNGGYVITWSSYGLDGSGQSIAAQQYAAELWGTNDSDTLIDDNGANWLSGQDGGDTLKGKAGKDFIYGGNGNDTLFGGTKRDKLYGESGKDDLIGGTGNDVLKGGNGNDDLLGGLDRDTLIGGNGNDTFIYEDVDESKNTSKADTIKDFVQGEDLIDLSALGGLTFIGASGFSGTGGAELRTGVSVADTLVRVDIDGDGSADMKIIVANFTGMIIDDFIL